MRQTKAPLTSAVISAATPVVISVGLSVMVALLIGAHLSSEAQQQLDVPVISKEHKHSDAISEDFSDMSALERFRMGAPDLGFKAGSSDTPPWSIKDKSLIGHKAHNATLWLKDPLPAGDVRISFRATARSAEGDVKVEVFGDGENHQSGYILINGGWKNSMRIIARQDEHGEDRRVDRRCGKRRQCAPEGSSTLWVIERRGSTISWYLDGELALRQHDSNPLLGRHFGFGCWSAEVSFDDLEITPI